MVRFAHGDGGRGRAPSFSLSPLHPMTQRPVPHLTNHLLPRSIYGVMMKQNGGSDAQLFHDRTRSRDAATGAGTDRSSGYASSEGEISQGKQRLVVTRLTVTGQP